ncbi:hypothetical protein E4U41_006073 [Claviceps citrina]|nr:hypothetical protein E4U41_006073 [Claviceps citrina]
MPQIWTATSRKSGEIFGHQSYRYGLGIRLGPSIQFTEDVLSERYLTKLVIECWGERDSEESMTCSGDGDGEARLTEGMAIAQVALLIDERYKIDYKIGQGGFGLVYAGTDTKTNEEVAIKLTHARGDTETQTLEYEAETYAALAGGAGIPHVHWYGQQDDYFVLVQELLGPSLEDVFNYCDRKFSLKTVLLIANQCIQRLRYIHEKGFLHCDVKPDNFLLGTGRNGNIIYTIDFGLARDFEADDGRGIMDNRPLGGTTRYASINHHKGKGLGQSRGDDLESLGYVLLYFAHSRLPWQGLKATCHRKRAEAILRIKEETPIDELCKGLPDAFANYIVYTRSLKPADKPNYAYLLKLFNTVFVANGFKYDNVFDWTEKRFYELQEENAEMEGGDAEMEEDSAESDEGSAEIEKGSAEMEE